MTAGTPVADGGAERGLYRLIAGWTVVYGTGSWLLEFAYSRLGVRHPDPVTLAVKCAVYAVVWGPLLAAAVTLSMRRPIRGPRDVGRIAVHAAVALAAPFVWGTLSYLLCLWLAPGWQALGFARMYRTTGYGVLYVYSVIVLICHVLVDIRRRHTDELAALEVAENAARARIQVLAMELQPHFVGNALHAVTALLTNSPRRAAAALQRLRNLLAEALRADRRTLVSMRDELAMLRWYTETQALRFGDRLRIEWMVDDAALDAAVPTMFLQPLVENAIKFSVEAIDRPGTVCIAADVRDRRLTVCVRDNGVGIGGAARRGQGVGLANVRERLRWLYGSDHSLRLEPARPGPGAIVEVSFPYRSLDTTGMTDVHAAGPLARTRDGDGGGAGGWANPSRGVLAQRSARWRQSILVRPELWTFLIGWAFALGLSAWGLDAVVAALSSAVPTPWWIGSARVVEALLTIPALTMAVVWTADRWPVRAWHDLRRIVGQAGIAVAVGPIWGTVAYALNPALALWNGAVGRWGMIAIEAKGVLFAYGTASVLAHAVLRARQQRARELAGHALRADLVQARVQAATLGIHTARITAALDAVLGRLPHDSAGAANVLVDVADAIERSLALSRSDTVPLREVLQLADAHARLLESVGVRGVFQADATQEALATRVAPMAVWPDLARAIEDAGGRVPSASWDGRANAGACALAYARVVYNAEAGPELVVRVDSVDTWGTTRTDREIRLPIPAD